MVQSLFSCGMVWSSSMQRTEVYASQLGLSRDPAHKARTNRRGYWFLQKKCPCAVPAGLRSEFVEFRFPTLKRGANKLCASGAPDRTLLMRCSIKPSLILTDRCTG